MLSEMAGFATWKFHQRANCSHLNLAHDTSGQSMVFSLLFPKLFKVEVGKGQIHLCLGLYGDVVGFPQDFTCLDEAEPSRRSGPHGHGRGAAGDVSKHCALRWFQTWLASRSP